MTYTTRLTHPELRQKASDIIINAEDVKKDLMEIEALINRLRSTFLGETTSIFFREFDAASMDFNQWDNIVRSFALEIHDAADRLEKADTSQ